MSQTQSILITSAEAKLGNQLVGPERSRAPKLKKTLRSKPESLVYNINKIKKNVDSNIRYIGLRTQIPYPTVPNLDNFSDYGSYIAAYESFVGLIPKIDKLNEERVGGHFTVDNKSEDVKLSEFIERRIRKNQEKRHRKLERLRATADEAIKEPDSSVSREHVEDPVVVKLARESTQVASKLKDVADTVQAIKNSELQAKAVSVAKDRKFAKELVADIKRERYRAKIARFQKESSPDNAAEVPFRRGPRLNLRADLSSRRREDGLHLNTSVADRKSVWLAPTPGSEDANAPVPSVSTNL